MTTKHLISMLAVLLLLASCVCAVSANTLTVYGVTLDHIGEPGGDVNLFLDSAPTGLSGYKVTFTITDPTVAEIVNVKYPSWSLADYTSSSVGPNNPNNVDIKVADVTDGIPASATNIYLGSVVVKGKKSGSTPITVTVNLMDDNGGSEIKPDVVGGMIAVQELPGSIKVTSTPAQGADIFIDGSTNPAWKTDTTISDIPPGLHTVTVKLLNYVDAEQTVNVESTKTANAVFTLVRSGTITVTSVPAGAKIFIDNRDTNQVTSPTGPVTFTGVAPGLRTVRVELDQYYSKSSSKTVLAGLTAKFSFTLTKIPTNEPPPYGYISVDSEPQGARIFIDGQDTLADTLSTIQGYPNTYNVKVTLSTYAPSETKQVTIVPYETKFVKFTLEPGVASIVKIVPRTLNIASKGVFVAFVTLPSGYNAADVDAKSVFCEGAPALRLVRVKLFPRTFAAIFSREKLVNVKAGDSVPLTVIGTIKFNGQNVKFAGTDTIKVISKKGTPKEGIDDVEKLTDEKVFSQHNPGYTRDDEKVFSRSNQRNDNNNNGKDTQKSR